MIFNMLSTSYFHKNLFHYFEDVVVAFGCVLVSLSGNTPTWTPPNYNSLSQTTWAAADDRSTHINTTQNNQILGCLESRVLDLQLSLYCLFTWYLNSLHHNRKQQLLLLLECGRVGPWKSLLSTLDAQVYLLTYTKDQNLVHHNFVKVVGYTPPIPPSPRTNKTKQNKTMGASPYSLALPFYI